MKTCPYHVAHCNLSRPCAKCRAAAVREAHTLVRFDAHGRRKSHPLTVTRSIADAARGDARQPRAA